MNGINRTQVVLILVVVLCVFIGFVVIFFAKGFNLADDVKSNQIKDTNGEIKQLCTITDEMIEDQTEQNWIIRRKIVSTGTHASGVKGKHEEHDNEHSRIKIGSLSGIAIFNAYLGDGGTVTYKIFTEVQQGNLKIVITDENNAILHDIPIDQESEVSFATQEGKVYYVKFVGESAKFTAKIDREV